MDEVTVLHVRTLGFLQVLPGVTAATVVIWWLATLAWSPYASFRAVGSRRHLRFHPIWSLSPRSLSCPHVSGAASTTNLTVADLCDRRLMSWRRDVSLQLVFVGYRSLDICRLSRDPTVWMSDKLSYRPFHLFDCDQRSHSFLTRQLGCRILIG